MAMFLQSSFNRDSILEFFKKYFISPITEISGYNWVNTTVYGFLLSVIALIVFRSVRQSEYEINLELFLVFLPYMVWGSTVRALVDADVYPYTYLLVSPGIIFTTLFIFAISVVVSGYLKQHVNLEYGQILFILGCILVTSQLALVIPLIQSLNIGLILTGSSTAISFVLWALRSFLQTKIPILKSRENFLVLLFHFLDANTTFIGVELYGYRELHILPHTLIDIFGSAIIMYPLKIAILFGVLYLIDHYVRERDMSLFIKLVLMAIGIVPAIRNFLRLVMEV